MSLAHSQSIGNDSGERNHGGQSQVEGRSKDNPRGPPVPLSNEFPLPPMAADTTVSPNAGIPSTLEISAPMLEVHAPHPSIHTWKDFFIHIATITIGLLIAVGLEQSIEVLHHRHQREQLEEQMRGVFETNLKRNERTFKQLKAQRTYLGELRTAISARLHGQPARTAPAANDERMAAFPTFPSLAPYEAAKENGTVALLPGNRIRIYNRVALARELAWTVRDHWFEGLSALEAFHERFVDSSGNLAMGQVAIAPDLDSLSAADLTDYLTIVSALIKNTELLFARLTLVDKECRAILDGVRDEDDLLDKISKMPNGSILGS
jgi:hypothetical protein